MRVAQLAVDGQPRAISTHDLELVEYVSPVGVRGDTGICNPGAAHLAITVDDIHDRHQQLVTAGVTFVSPPNEITAGVNRGGFRATSVIPTTSCSNSSNLRQLASLNGPRLQRHQLTSSGDEAIEDVASDP